MTCPTRQQLLDDVLNWVANEVDGISRKRSTAAVRDPNAVRRSDRSQRAAAAFPRVNRNCARRHAVKLPEIRHFSAASDNSSLADMASTTCVEWGATDAAPLASRWFEGGTPSDGDVKMDTGELALLVGTATAAIILAILWALRGGRPVRVRRRKVELAPSSDFAAIREVASGQDEVAAVAQRLVAAAKEPWRWEIADVLAHSSLDQSSLRTLCARLSALGLCNVSPIDPAVGSRFETATMSAPVNPSPEDVWIVADVRNSGYRVGAGAALKAQTEISTIDAWVLLDERCPVGRVLGSRAEDLLPGGRDGRRRWRATWGVTYPNELRDMFDEASLQAWRARVIAHMSPAYEGRPGRQLVLTGQAGAVFERSTMEADFDVPRGDAVVAAVVERDGIPQHGLACPGGSPLLLAVVRAMPEIDRELGTGM